MRCSLALLLWFALPCAGLSADMPRYSSIGLLTPPLRAIYTRPGELNMLVKYGHAQGATCSERAIYVSHSGGIVKLDWTGRVVKSVTARPHLGDIAYSEGRIYGVFGLRKHAKGESPIMVGVWNEDLDYIESRRYDYPGARGIDGAVVLDGILYTSVDSHFDAERDHPPHCDNVMMMVSADDLSMVGTNTIVFDYPIHYGTQTLATDGKHILFGNYGAKRTQGNTAGLCFSRATTGMELLDSHSFYVSEGFCLVPKSVSGRDTPVFLKVVALGGNMQGWRKDPKNNPPRLRFDFYAYDVATGVMTNITDYSGARGAELALFRHRCAAAGQKGAICVGWATSMEKVRPRDGVLPKVATDLFVRLARGEKESVQLFVVPMSGDLRNVKVAVNGDLAMQNGDAAFAASNIAVSVLGYLNITNKPPYKTGRNVATTNSPGYRREAIPASLGWWPDPILSHLDHADVLGDDVQGFWIRVRAPDDQRAGLYEGRVTVSAAGVEPVDLPFTVRVNDFSVPKKPMLPLAVPFQGISRQKDINRDAANAPDAPPKLWGRHRDEWIAFMSDHYVSCAGLYSLVPNFEMLERQKSLGFEGDYNLGCFDAPKTTTNEAVVAEWREKTVARLVKSYEKAKSLGIADRAFIYGCDEYKWHLYDKADWAAAEIKKALPGVPIMTTARDYGFGESGKLKSFDCFVSPTDKYNFSKAEAARKRGQRVWWYFACGQDAPYANCFIEGQGVEMRSVMGAQAVKYRPDGFLYYWIGSNCSYRPAGDDPFTECEPRTWFRYYHGDGGWLSCGPDGIPLSTIRFENFADGLEDYAYAKLLEEKLRAVESKKLKAESAGGDNWIRRAKKALAVPDTVVQSVGNYTDDPAVIYRWRDEMADLIEEGAVVAECGGAARPLRFMTFNIFGAGYDPERGGPGGFKAEEREGRAMALVRRYSPDIISWQEVNEQWWPSPLFCGMEEYGVVRGDEDEALVRAGADLSKRRPHWVNHEPLMYRKDRLVLLDSGLDFYHISLQFEKSLTWAVLEDRSDRRRFIAFATHFWWKKGEEADAIRELNARHVLWRIDAIRAKWGNLPVIGGGDLNCVKGSLALKTFDQFGYDDAGETAPVRSTVPSEHGALVRDAEGHCRGRVGKVGEKGHCMIDHVLCERGRVVPLRHDVVIDEDAVDISDHSPVVVDFAFK